MATIKISSTKNWNVDTANQVQHSSIWNKFTNMADSQADNKTLWFVVSLIAQGVLFLPVPAILIYYYNAPVLIVVATLALFFANVIAGMGGAGIRTLLTLFFASVIAHLLILIVFIL
ncbi:hypothetical protein KXD93_18210 [Mucilaginibacter sp. BJC16-A38]|uniref:hypothetical protein n=1 Tax=Mucilaginibacter phenanthrenivorans TaxID=1234842 RepID=UPI002157C237|nr:hypothetical protein [Mucilaginibacter phenanthrenivorans]MCR8559598.1 hypothetical protein [Mucilaginibacter phenanthrenivorans]